MKLYSTCRFCKKASFETPDLGMVRYGPRHWCHWECGAERFGFVEFASKLNAAQIATVPAFIVDGHPDRVAFMQRWASQ